MYWDQLTSGQIDQVDKSIPVLLPVAATEQHGPHLPLSTDRMIGEHFCTELDKKQPDDVLILPTIGVGCSEHHLDFPGSLSVQHETLLRTITDQVSSVIHHGFRHVIVFNSHGGNQAIGQTFVETFGYRQPTCKIVLITWWRIASEALQRISEAGPGGTGHAGELETSLMLLIAPHLVHKDVIPKKANSPSFDWASGDLLGGPRASYYRSMKELTPTGVYGDPGFGSEEKGREITESVITALVAILNDISQS